MHQGRLLNTTPEEELEGCVWALGGWQKAAALLWPTEDPTTKGRDLRNALAPDRREKLSELEREALIVAAAAKGYFGPVERLNRLCGCKPPEVVTPEEAEGAATVAVQAATEALQQALALLGEARERKVRVVR